MKLLLPLLILPAIVLGYCDPEFTRVGEKCLSFVTHLSMTFEEASEYCYEMRGASLVTIDSAKQFKSLIDYIYASELTSTSYWVDGNDKATEGVWLGSSGKLLPMGTPFWAGFPDHQEPYGFRTENCVKLYDLSKFYMHDFPCNQTNSFICEQADFITVERKYEVPEVKSCPLHYVEIGGKCLSFMTYEEVTWEDAQLRCRDKEGDLAIVDDIELLREINLYIQAKELTDHSFWLGASDSQEEGQWFWRDGSPVSMGVPFWGLRRYRGNYFEEPDGSSIQNHLALLSEGYFYFRDVSGHRLLHPLCQLIE